MNTTTKQGKLRATIHEETEPFRKIKWTCCRKNCNRSIFLFQPIKQALGFFAIQQNLCRGKHIGRIGAGLLAGGAIANTAERYFHGKVTDYVYLKDSRIPLLRRRIWNIADAAVFNGAVLAAAGILLGGEL